jgi:hypothetical protein
MHINPAPWCGAMTAEDLEPLLDAARSAALTR